MCSRLIAAMAFTSLLSAKTVLASLLFDNISAYESGTTNAGVTDTSSTPNTFMGDGYVLATGATDITGLDVFPVNLSGTKYTGLQINVFIWGSVNMGTVNASAPAFSNLLGTYSLNTSGTYASGNFYPFEGTPRGVTPGFTFATPLQLNGITTVGLTFVYEGTTNGTAYRTASNLMSLISYGVAPTTGSDVFNGYYRNANSETNGNFTSTIRSLNLADQSLAVRIFGDITSSPDDWIAGAGGDWTVASNWSTSAVPASTDDAAFNLSSSNYTVTLPGAINCKNLYVQSDNLTLDLSTSNSSLSISSALTVGQPATAGTNINGVLSLTHSSGGSSANVSAATLAVGGNGGTGQLSIGSAISLSVAGTVSVGTGSSLTIASGGKMYASNLSLSGSVNAWNGLVDIGSSDLDLPFGDLATVTNQVKQGYSPADPGHWNGSGGITSSVAANDSTHLTAVGVIINNDGSGNPLYGVGGALGAFGSNTPSLNDILIRLTYFGDANLDGKVDASDYSLIDNGYLNHLTGWYNGDFNYDGVINGSDYTLIDNAFNTQGGRFIADAVTALSGYSIIAAAIPTALAAPTTANVPEPVNLGFLAISIVSLLGRRPARG